MCFTFLWDLPASRQRAAQGPGGGRAGPVWLVLSVTEADPPTSDLKQTRVPSAGAGPRGSRGIDHLSILRPEGLPPPRNLSAAERSPRLHGCGIFSPFSLRTFFRDLSINGSAA